MPTFTHNRVKNGVNGKQYTNMHPGNIFQRRRVSSNPANGKYASNVVTGRSFAAKRAIARRVSRQMPVKPLGEEGRRDAEGNIIVSDCCNLPTVTISRPVQKYSKGKTSSSDTSSDTESGTSSSSSSGSSSDITTLPTRLETEGTDPLVTSTDNLQQTIYSANVTTSQIL